MFIYHILITWEEINNFNFLMLTVVLGRIYS